MPIIFYCYFTGCDYIIFSPELNSDLNNAT